MNKTLNAVLATTLFAASLLQGELFAKTSAPKDSTKKESAYEEFIKKKPETHKGFITVHKLKGKVYFEIPEKMMGRLMLLGSTISETSDNGDGLIGSKPDTPQMVAFSKIGENVNLLKMGGDYITDSESAALREALTKNSAGAVIGKFKIDSYTPDSTAVVIDVTDFFVSDKKDMRPFDSFSENTFLGQAKRTPVYESDKSFLGEVKAFETNLSVRSHLSYKYSINYKTRTLAEDVPFTAVLTRSLILLDEQPYRSRPVDSRIAIFPTGKILYSEKEQGAKVVYFANRWRLEPSDTAAYRAGKLVEPVKPIVFYIDPAFPEEWKPAIYTAVNQWQEPFEKIGFKNAIVARDFPTDDPEFDPDNIKYSCIRYAPVRIENAMGPSWVDPRSGEILNASVYVYHDVVKLINNWRFIQTAQADESVRSGSLPEDVFSDALRYVIAHEVGHCLGMMHNMSASACVPVDSLRSPSFTQKYGTTYSIMDYARFNYVAQPGDKEKGVSLTPPRFGLYDYFTIRYSYTPLFEDSLEEEARILDGWIREAQADPIYRYGKQQGRILDPRSQHEDLGDNAVKASRYGISNLRYILSNMKDWIKDDPDYTYTGEIYTGIIYQYLTYIQHVFANIGGVYLWEKHSGDPVEHSYLCVERERQKEAFDFLYAQVYDLEWLDNHDLMKQLPIMGSPASVLQTAIIEAVVASPFKIASTEKLSRGEQIYTFSECMEDLYRMVWEPSRKKGGLSDIDMAFQREFVANVFSAAGFKYRGFGARTKGIASFAMTDPAEVSTPDFLLDYKMRSDLASGKYLPVSGYSQPQVMFATNPIHEPECYSYALKTRKLLEKLVKSSSGDEKAHYTLMLRNIQNTLK